MLKKQSAYFRFERKLCFISFLLLLSFITFAQQKVTVKGTVMSDKNVPLSNVSVKVDGAAIGTTTEPDGSFTLGVNKGAVLVFSIIGYEEKRIKANQEQLNLMVQLNSKVSSLNEVVVLGYGTQQKKDLTGSVATVDQKAIADLPVSSVDQKMIGQVAGVQILQQTGAPGSGTSVKIRGSGSIGAGNEPLYVVDGMPYSAGMNQNLNPLVFINPNDIESITVLKDASSTAIYGSRGANGVIMIVTKKGAYNKTRINASVMTGTQQVPQKGRPDMMDQQDYIQLQRDKIDIVVRQRENRAATIDDYPVEYQHPEKLVGKGTNWYDLLLRTANTQDYNISVSKGTESSLLNLNVEYLKQDGTLRYTGVERFSSKIGIESKLGKSVTISASLQPTFIKQNRATTNENRSDMIGISLWANPTVSPYDADGQLIPYLKSPANKYFKPWDFPNPLYVLQQTTQLQQQFQNLGIAFVEWEIIPGLKAKTSLSTNWATSKYFEYNPSTVGAPNKPPVPGNGRSTNSRGESFDWLNENTLTYDRMFGDHRFNALLGYTAEHSTNDNLNVNAYPFASDQIQTINAAQAINTWGESVGKWSMVSYLARLNYAYKNRYLLTATIRSDGSSRFGAENRFATFPSVAAAWRVSEEDFLNQNKIISNLKLRASYGRSGNNNIGNYSALASIDAEAYVFGNTIVTASSVGLANPFLTWEASDEADVGIDMGLFDGRLNFIADYYNRKTKNMLLNNVIPTITGFNQQLVNAGNVQNVGFELSLGGTPVLTKAFTWNINMNIAFNRNKVLSLNENNDQILSGNNDGNSTHVTLVGKPIGQFFGFILEGVYSAEDMTNPAVAKYPSATEGSVKYKDLDGDGKITDVLDYTEIGNPYPDFTFGINNSFSFQRFDLNIILYGQSGGHVVNGLRQTVDNLQGFFNVSEEWVNRWRSPQQPGDGIHSGVITNTPSLGHRFSTLWVEDASFLRIGNVTLGYNIPEKWMKASHFISNARVYFTVQNLATFTKYSGGNPQGQSESQTNVLNPGFDMTSYPLSRITSFGINLSF
jgi:TonB-linked SusC/RagA family outer membrane protein